MENNSDKNKINENKKLNSFLEQSDKEFESLYLRMNKLRKNQQEENLINNKKN